MALGSLRLRTVAAPGHTADHVLYHEPGRRVLFTGDALFVGGCGRRFGVGADVMWRSLRLLRELPDDTQVYCGHEYGEDNLEFAAQIEPANPAIARRRAALEQRLRAGHPGVPSLLGEEKATNPFLRADVDAVGRAVGLPDGGPVEVFAELRRRKDEW
jgi:hydroxyacylglutathione hydrolase